MKKNITIGLMAAGIIFLVYVLLSDGCGKQTDSHQDDYDQVKDERDKAIAWEKASNMMNDSLMESLHQANVIIADLTAATEMNRIELDRSKSRASRLAMELQAYKREKDTSEYGRKLDSLLQEVVVLTAKVTDYEHLVDSLTKQFLDQKLTYEALLSEKAQLYAQLRGSYDLVYNKYTQMFTDYSDRGKSLKKEKLKSKIAALLALVATGLFIAK